MSTLLHHSLILGIGFLLGLGFGAFLGIYLFFHGETPTQEAGYDDAK